MGFSYPSRLNEESNLALYYVALPNVRVFMTRPFLEYKAEVTLFTQPV